jgi:hypothetical protein
MGEPRPPRLAGKLTETLRTAKAARFCHRLDPAQVRDSRGRPGDLTALATGSVDGFAANGRCKEECVVVPTEAFLPSPFIG